MSGKEKSGEQSLLVKTLLIYVVLVGSGLTVFMFPMVRLRPRAEFRCRTECDGPEFSWELPGISPGEIFPSLDSNSSEYDPDSPNYCRHYKATHQ